MTAEVTRVVALGASNLTLGLHTVVSTARGAWGKNIEVLAANGYGRSYGAPSRIVGRLLPGILESGLWDELRRLPEARTRGVVTDVGNDVLYGFPPPQVLAWVEEAVDRLLIHTSDVTLTSLPGRSVESLSRAKFLFFRTIFFPRNRISRDQTVARLDEVDRGLDALAEARRLRFVRLRPEWYGFDPIHFRHACWRSAWTEILVGEAPAGTAAAFSPLEWARMHALPPDHRWLFGLEQKTQQTGRRLRRGGRLWLY